MNWSDEYRRRLAAAKNLHRVSPGFEARDAFLAGQAAKRLSERPKLDDLPRAIREPLERGMRQ